MTDHKYSKYRPPWCNYPPFESMDYCWGLALAVDRGILPGFFEHKCCDCDMSKNYIEEAKP
jgi:hypothetical protein